VVAHPCLETSQLTDCHNKMTIVTSAYEWIGNVTLIVNTDKST